MAEIGNEVKRQIEDLYPAQIGQQRPDRGAPAAELPERFLEAAAPVRTSETGYLQAVDGGALVRVAAEYDLLLRVEYRPGNFISKGQVLALAWPPESLDDAVGHRIRQAFAWGRQRTLIQDVLYPVDELVEIAARALSPAMNDPFTAMNCLDWLGSGLADLARREIPDAFRYDERGCLRVVSYPVTLVDMTDAVFGQLMPYFGRDRNAVLHMMKTIADLADGFVAVNAHAVLLQYAEALLKSAREHLRHDYDLREVEDRYKVIAHLLRNRADHRGIVEGHRWIEGGA